MTDEYKRANRLHWDERVTTHVGSAFYGVDAFLAGDCPLKPADLDLMGDVAGLRLAHLQCHFGLDTLGWARRGAEATGLDFSPEAVAAARTLAARAELEARFECADVYDAVNALGETYDRVVTGVGALVWLPDIRTWAQVVSALLKPGGVLVVREMHPMLYTIDDTRTDGVLAVRYPYFETAEPLGDDTEGSYADKTADLKNRQSYCWNHGVGEVVQAILDAGLRLEQIREYRDCDWEPLPHHGMVQGDHGMWRLPSAPDELPMMLGLRAVKPN